MSSSRSRGIAFSFCISRQRPSHAAWVLAQQSSYRRSDDPTRDRPLAHEAPRALVAETPGLTLELLKNSVPPSARRIRIFDYDLLTEIGLSKA